MAERKIEIAVAAVGADTAAAEIQKSTRAVDDLTAAGGKAAEQTKKLGEESEGANPKLDKLIAIGRAEVAGNIAKGLDSVSRSCRQMADDFQDADPELSGTLRNMAEGLDQVGSMARGAAQGFAIAGPAGAAVGAALAAAAPQVRKFYDAYIDLVAGLGEVEDSFRNLQEMEEGTAERHEEMVRRIAEADAKKQFKADAEAAAELAKQLAGLAKVEAARSGLAEAEADAQDAADLADGADPNEIAKRKIRRKADAEAAKIDSDLERQRRIVEAEPDPQKRAEMADAYGYEAQAGIIKKREIEERAREGIRNVDRGVEKKREDMLNQHAEDNIEMEIRIQKEKDAQEAKAAARLSSAADRLGGSTASAMDKLADKMDALARRVDTHDALIRNTRIGR